jgi:hypothetical protein
MNTCATGYNIAYFLSYMCRAYKALGYTILSGRALRIFKAQELETNTGYCCT